MNSNCHRFLGVLGWILVVASGTWGNEPAFYGPIPISDTGSHATENRNPAVAMDDNGNVVCVWWQDNPWDPTGRRYSLMAARSDDAGQTWQSPVVIHSEEGMSRQVLYMEPLLETDGFGTWVVVTVSSEDHGRWSFASFDNGCLWTAPVALSMPNTPFPPVTTKGSLACDGYTWIFLVSKEATPMMSRSVDGGRNWSPFTGFPQLRPERLDGEYLLKATPALPPEHGDQWEQQPRPSGTWLLFYASDRQLVCARSTDSGVTWGEPRALPLSPLVTNGPIPYAVAADRRGNWIALGRAAEGAEGLTYQTAAWCSRDDGVTWSEPLPAFAFSSSFPRGFYGLDLAADGSGNWTAVFGPFHQIYASSSSDLGATWSPPERLNSETAASGTFRIASSAAGRSVCVWASEETMQGSAAASFHIYASSSAGAGAWSEKTMLSDRPCSGAFPEQRPSITEDGSGGFVGVWEEDDPVTVTRGIRAARATTGPFTWEKGVLLDTAATGTPAIASMDGTCIAVWGSRNDLGGTIGGDSDILCARSFDAGRTWTRSLPVNASASADSARDSTPSISVDGRGRWLVVWSSDSLEGTAEYREDIFAAFSDDAGATWSAPARLTDGPHLINHVLPVVANDGKGTWIAAWRTRDHGPRVLYARSIDNGVSWLPWVVMPEESSLPPRLATDGEGTWRMLTHTRETSPQGVLFGEFISTDNGATWSPARSIAPVGFAFTVAADIAYIGSGLWRAAWILDQAGVPPNNLGQRRMAMVSQCYGDRQWDEPSLINVDDFTGWFELEHNTFWDEMLLPDFISLSRVMATISIVRQGPDGYAVFWDSESTFGGTLGHEGNIVGAVLARVDTDDDGLTDDEELRTGTNPLCSDTDGDGLPDAWEVRVGLSPVAGGIDGGAGDWDGDGFSNLEEHALGTDPLRYFSRPGLDPSEVPVGGPVAIGVLCMVLMLSAGVSAVCRRGARGSTCGRC